MAAVFGSALHVASGSVRAESFFSLIPKEHVVAYECNARGSAREPQAANGVAVLVAVADQATRLGITSQMTPSIRPWLEALQGVAEVARFPHGAVILDYSARARSDGGHEIAGLRAGLWIRCGESRATIDRRIQHVLNSFANDRDTTLEVRTVGGIEVHRIRDRRLNDWVEIQWGVVEGAYLITLGPGSWERMTATKEATSSLLSSDAWFRQAFESLNAEKSDVALHIHFDRLLQHADLSLSNKIRRVMKAIKLDGADRGLWTLGRRDRATVVEGKWLRGDHTESVVIADARFRGKSMSTRIPEGAASYTILDCDLESVAQGISEAYQAARSPEAAADFREFWSWVRQSSGVDPGRDILGRLGSCVVIHDFPRHALGLPLAWTVTVDLAEGADRAALIGSIDRLLAFAQSAMAEAGGPQLIREADGLWYLQFGLAGPAVWVGERELVLSFSPQAVRMNLPPAPKSATP